MVVSQEAAASPKQSSRSSDPENHGTPLAADLRKLQTPRSEQKDLAHRLTCGEDRLSARKLLLQSRGNYIFTIGLRHARKERKLLNQSNSLAHYGPRIEAFVRIQSADLHRSRTRRAQLAGQLFSLRLFLRLRRRCSGIDWL